MAIFCLRLSMNSYVTLLRSLMGIFRTREVFHWTNSTVNGCSTLPEPGLLLSVVVNY